MSFVLSRIVRQLDARWVLTVAAVFSSCVWAAPVAGLGLYSLVALLLAATVDFFTRSPQGTVRRSLLFCCFWPLLAFVADAAPVILTAYKENALMLLPLWDALAPYALKALLLFWRLALLMTFALWLTTAASGRALALATTWFLRPLLGQQAWKPALALAMMTSFLPMVHQTLAQTRQAARIRRLPDRGWTYWEHAVPHMFRCLQGKSLTQATAVVCRKLDAAEAWEGMPKLDATQSGCALLLLACAVVPLAC